MAKGKKETAQTTTRTRAAKKPNADSEWLKSEFLGKNLRAAIKYGRSKEAYRMIHRAEIPVSKVFNFWLEDSEVQGNREALGICFLHGFNEEHGGAILYSSLLDAEPEGADDSGAHDNFDSDHAD